MSRLVADRYEPMLKRIALLERTLRRLLKEMGHGPDCKCRACRVARGEAR